MKLFSVILLLCSSVANLHGEIRFAGFFKEQGACLFSLSDTESDVGGWYKIGDRLNGLLLTEFDELGEQLTLAGPSGIIHIRLVSSKIGPERKWDDSKKRRASGLD